MPEGMKLIGYNDYGRNPIVRLQIAFIHFMVKYSNKEPSRAGRETFNNQEKESMNLDEPFCHRVEYTALLCTMTVEFIFIEISN
jgi:hypothetical protein